MGNSTTAGRRSARGKANRYQRARPPQRTHHPSRRIPSQSQRGNQHQQSHPAPRTPSNLAKGRRRLPSKHQQQQQHGNQDTEFGSPPRKRRRVDSQTTESTSRQDQHAEGDAMLARPPNIAVADPDGQLLRDANGVQARIPNDPTRPLSIEDKRVLRSQGGGPRSYSDLVQFFPDYEDYVFGDSKQQDRLTVASMLYVTEDKSSSQTLPIRTVTDGPSEAVTSAPPRRRRNTSNTDADHDVSERDDVPDLSAFEKEAWEFRKDPLPDSEFLKAHKRGERNEKQMRNVEKERAMHEKSELERLYDELRGADWLKAMGVSGITETEKKQFEPKRDYYIVKVKTLLTKFEKWREQEKELKVKREKAIAAKVDHEETEDPKATGGPQVKKEETTEEQVAAVEDRGMEKRKRSGTRSSRKPGPEDESSKAKSAQAVELDGTEKKHFKQGNAAAPQPALEAWDSAQSLTSFYSKPHEAEAAKSKHRRGGRHATAFGQALPAVNRTEFGLPDGFLTSDEIRDHARKRRRDKRESLKS